MVDKFAVSDVFLNAKTKLKPLDAVAAIIVNDKNQPLMQLRDDLEHIFFPNHWGCFGGAIEPGETPHQALIRELQEETGVDFTTAEITQFITINFNPKPESKSTIWRYFFIVHINEHGAKNIKIAEGRECRFFERNDVLKMANVSPYDRFGLWLYFNQDRLTE